MNQYSRIEISRWYNNSSCKLKFFSRKDFISSSKLLISFDGVIVFGSVFETTDFEIDDVDWLFELDGWSWEAACLVELTISDKITDDVDGGGGISLSLNAADSSISFGFLIFNFFRFCVFTDVIELVDDEDVVRLNDDGPPFRIACATSSVCSRRPGALLQL